MKFSTKTTLILIAILFAVTSLGCERNSTGDHAALEQGQLVFEDDFESGELGDHWQTGFEGWRVIDGALHVQGAQNDALWLQERLPENFRVQFSARSDSDAGDIKFEILGDGSTHESGYIGIFGGWQNELNIIARLDEHGDDRLVGAPGSAVEPGQTYRMDVVRTDERLRWYIDEELFLSYDDPNPLTGSDHRFFAFNNWDTELTFDDLQVFDLDD